MQSCINCYHSWMCRTKTPDFYKKHLENDEVCILWEDDSLDYDEYDE